MEEELWNWWFESPNKEAFYIHNFGELNKTDGPDILDAEIEVEKVIYRGSVEFDYNCNGWIQHGHFQHFRYENTLLHIWHDGKKPYYHGNIPSFSYSLLDNKLRRNIRDKESFAERKSSFLSFYAKTLNYDELIFLLFCRTLGYYQNRDLLCYVAFLLITKTSKEFAEMIEVVLKQAKKRAVRPNNRISIRLKQASLLYENSFWISECLAILRTRLEINFLIKEFSKLFNRENNELSKIGKDRVILFLFNWLIPLEYLNNENNIGYRSYLDAIFEHCKGYAALSKIHSKSDLEMTLSDLSFMREKSF